MHRGKRTETSRGYLPAHARPGPALRAARALRHGAARVIAAPLWPEYRLYRRLSAGWN